MYLGHIVKLDKRGIVRLDSPLLVRRVTDGKLSYVIGFSFDPILREHWVVRMIQDYWLLYEHFIEVYEIVS